MTQLEDDCFAHGGAPMSVARALELIDEIGRPLTGIEDVPLAAAAGRILARDIVATIGVPPHDNAAVDGFAVFHDDLASEGSTALPVGARIAAGHPLERPPRRGEALRVLTGAALPGGPDTVFMQEDASWDGDRVVLPPGLKPGANRRRAGEDVAPGSTILAAGRRLRPPDVGLAASVGRVSLPCRAALDVALFSTGDEVTEPGAPLRPGAVYDANRYAVMALLRALGARVSDLGILRDEAAATRDAILDAARRHHVLVTSGGVSVGDEDHVRATLAGVGRLHAWYLAIKPGRPLMLGQVGGAAFIGLPGNPAAAMVTFLRFARPLLLRLAGARPVAPLFYAVRSGFERGKKAGRREYVRVRLRDGADGALEARAFEREGAGILSSLVDTDGLAELPEDMTRLEKGAMIRVLPFSEVMG